MQYGHPITIKAPNDIEYLEVIQSGAEILARKMGFEHRDCETIKLVIEEGVANIIQHAFEPEEESFFTVTLEPTPSGLRIELHDDGLPYAPDETAAEGDPSSLESSIGMKLMRAFMDTFSFIYSGPDGKRIIMEKFLKTKSASDDVSGDDVAAYHEATPPREVARIPRTVRRLNPDDRTETLEIAQCAYKAYGYGYLNTDIYFPEKLAMMNRDGTLASVVAVSDTDGDVMGHSALKLSRKGDKVAEAGVSFVKPRYRGQEVFGELVDFRIRLAREMGLTALFTHAVAKHPASQKACIKSGYLESGFSVGTFAVNTWKGFSFSDTGQRISLLYAVLYLKEMPEAAVCLPPRHEAMLREIYEHHGRAIRQIDPAVPTETESRTEMNCLPAAQYAEIRYHSIGADAAASIKRQMRHASRSGIVHTELVLPLSSPHTPWLCELAEELDFYFAGLILDSDARDVLILQHNACEVDYDAICAPSDFGKKLLAYVRSTDPGEGDTTE